MNSRDSLSTMQDHNVTEDVSKQLQLLTISQTINLIGSWEWDLHSGKLLWTDAMFMLRAIPVSADNLISIEENYKYVHEDDREMVKQKIESLKQKQDVTFEYRVVTPAGQVKIISAWAALFRDEKGEQRYIRGTSQDITRLRQVEMQLYELNLVLENAEEIVNMGNWQWKLKKNEFVFSKNLYRLIGCEPYEFEPSYENFRKFVHPLDQDKVFMAHKHVQDIQLTSSFEFRIIRKDGQVRHLKSIGKLVTNNESEVIILGTMQDITEEVQMRKQLEEKILFAEMLIENSIDQISAFDTDNRVIAWNKKCEEKYHLKKEEVLGKNVLEMYPHLADNKELAELHKALKGEFIHQAGQYGYDKQFYEYYIIPLRKSNNEVFGALSITHDLTAVKNSADRLKQLNQSLEQKNHELERSNDELANFSYVASHDLQEPLRKIQTFSKLISEKDYALLSEKGRDYFNRIESASKRMQVLIDDLLTYSRTTNSPKNFAKTDLNLILSEAKHELRDSIEEKKAVIRSDELPVAHVISFQFRQLLMNLLMNSIKYSKTDVPPQIRITYEKIPGKNISSPNANPSLEYHLLCITDNGIGFEQQYALRIFELFQRLHGRYEYPGTGLGLAICKKIMENHHGFIEATSVLNEGATFMMYFPIQPFRSDQ